MRSAKEKDCRIRPTFYVRCRKKSGNFCQSRVLSSGFTLLELLITVAIIGVLSAVLIPNLLDAMNKAKQKRSMMDIRSLGSAWMSWLTDQVGSASAGQQKFYDQTGFAILDYTELHGHLRPTDTFFYAQEVPQMDAWQHEYRYARHPVLGSSNGLLICSGGQDRAFVDCNSARIPVDAFLSTDYSNDLIWADGFFVRWPQGLQR